MRWAILLMQQDAAKKGLMLIMILFAVVLSGCLGMPKDMPEEPDGATCTPIIGYTEIPYAFCRSYINPDDPAKQYRVPLDEFLKEKPIMVPPEFYVKIIKWAEDVEKWGEKNCKQGLE